MCYASILKPKDIGTIYSNTKRGNRGEKIRRTRTQITHERKHIRHETRRVNPNNNIEIKRKESTKFKFPNIYLANARSINYKKDELSCEMKTNCVDIAIITETWLNENIPNEPLAITGYDLMRKDRIAQTGGGVCAYVNSTIPYKRWIDLENENFESLWLTFRPAKLPRDVTNITLICVYHPPQANNEELKDHLCQGIDYILSKHLQSGLLVLGYFNSFSDGYLISSLNLTQIVKVATRNNRTLDKCYTNIANFYEKPTILPHLGKSDQHPVLLRRSNAPATIRDNNVSK